MKKYLLVFLALVLFVGGLYLGYRVFRPQSSITVNSQTVLTMLQSEGFFVTQSYVVNQMVEIKTSTGSDFKDLFWKQDIQASANVKVSSGVDLSKLTAESIQVTGSQIIVTLPAVSTQSVELIGNVLLQNKQGILKKIFDNDDGYNVAVAKIQEEARAAAETAELRADAKANAEREIKRLLRYVDLKREVVVKFTE